MDALGGNFCVDDISSVLQNPAASVYYKDVVQGTAYQDGTFGPVIGIKSIGKKVSVGFAANIPDDFQSTFFNDARTFLDSTVDTQAVIPGQYSPYPHLIAALDLPFLKIGGEIFFKRASHESGFNDNGKRLSYKKEITTTGINVNTSFMLGKIGVYPFAMYAVPSMSGIEMSSSEDSTITVTITTSANRSIKCGLEFGFTPGNSIFTIGGVLFDERYTFQSTGIQRNNIARNVVSAIDLYGGITTCVSENIMLSLVYDYSRGSYICNSEADSNNQTFIRNEEYLENFHFTVASCEVTQEIQKIGMSIIFRAGVNWLAGTTTWNSQYHEEGYQYDENNKNPDVISQFVPTMGIGIQKGIIRFDVASKLAGWSGIVSGLPIVTGTLTFDFGKVVSGKGR